MPRPGVMRMSDQHTIRLPDASSGSGASSFLAFDPEIQHGMYRRLGGVALVYSGAWLANFIYFQLTLHAIGVDERRTFWYVTTTVCTAFGVAVYALCRMRRIPPRSFSTFAVVFEIVGAVGIMAGWLGWEHHGEEMLRRIAAAFELDGGDLAARVVEPLMRENFRVLYHEGVTWVSVWLLVFPLVVPFSLGRTIAATLLTATTVPAVVLASLAINGVPAALRPWILPYVLELAIPTYICAGIAIFGSRVVFALTRDLSKARRMGSYQLAEKIGAGGMGEVWKAKHRLLARPAAIKLIRPEALGGNRIDAATALRRFEREAQATAELSSPHSIELYDFGITEDGTFYYVMELLRGLDLKTLVERHGPIPAERTLHVLRQACHSLTDAHLVGVVHRDIKPGNIFICRRGPEYDFVKVLDFGLVKQLGDLEPGAEQLTVEGIASGTPAFMAPEMAYDPRAVDARADIYALGCVAYWLVTGQLVFEGTTPMALLVQHAKDAPPRPSTRTELAIPAALERIILDCLQKDPAARPQSAAELAERLATCEDLARLWTQERALQWWRAHMPDLAHSPAVAAPA